MGVELDFDYLSEDTFEMVSRFCCKDEVVTGFLIERENALEQQLHNSAITRLYFEKDDGPLVGFASLQASQVKIEAATSTAQKWNDQLPRLKRFLPAVHLLYFGIDQNYESRGYGQYVMLDVIRTARSLQSLIGCNFIYVEALKNQRTQDFYRQQGFVAIEDEDDSKDDIRMVLKLKRLDLSTL